MTLRRANGSQAQLHSLADDSLIALTLAGQSEAFAELYRRHAPMTVRVVQRITKNREDTEDVVQETFSRAYVHLAGFDGRSRFSTWLTRIAVNCALMLYRKSKRLREHSLETSPDEGHSPMLQIPDLGPSPESQCVVSNARAELAKAVSNLPARLKLVMNARLHGASPTQEIANIAGLSLAATKSRIMRATRQLELDLSTSHTRHTRRTGSSFGHPVAK